MAGRVAGLEPAGVLLELRRSRPCVGEPLFGDEAVGEHAVQHEVAAPEAGSVVAQWVEAAGRLDEAGEHRGLVHGQVQHVLVEVGLGRRLDAVGAVAEVHGVEVLEEDEVLAVLVLESQRVPELLELPGGRLFGVLDDRQLDVLLGDRRAALADATRLEVGAGRPDDGLQVDPVMVVEAFVLDGDDGVADELGDLVEATGACAILGSDKRGDEGAVPGDDDRRLGCLGNGDLEGAGLVRVAARGEHRDHSQGRRRATKAREGPVLVDDLLRHPHSLAASRHEGAAASSGSEDEKVGIGRSERQW